MVNLFLLKGGQPGTTRTFAILICFALILSAYHLSARKERALHMALALLGISAVLHAATADWTVVAISLSAAGILTLARNAFTVGSARPDLRLALKRTAVAVLLAGLYGTAGFWLLEPHDFGQNFHWWEAALRTLRVMLTMRDSGLLPRTPQAQWFLDSLYLMSAATFLYAGLTLFRPVAYCLHSDSAERDLAARIAAAHGRSGQDYFKIWPDKSLFFSPGGHSFLAYRVAGNYALVLGDPVGPDDEAEATIRQFLHFCRRRGWRVGFHQVPAARLELYRKLGFRHVRIGEDALVDLASFTLKGSAAKEFRNTVARLDRLGYRVERVEGPVDDALFAQLKRVSDEWLATAGHRERRFTLGRFDTEYIRSTSLYVALDEQCNVAAFLNLIPSYRPGLATVDLMRGRAGAPNGVMDYLFAKAFLDLKEQGFSLFSLGMAPGALSGKTEAATSRDQVVSFAMRRLPRVFRADSLRRFKGKYAQQWEPRYAVYGGRFDLPRLALALRRISEEDPVAA
jgi:phosphatidylglycerol lysyltransferase